MVTLRSPDYRSVLTQYALYGSLTDTVIANGHPLEDRCTAGEWFIGGDHYACRPGDVPTEGTLTYPRYLTVGLFMSPILIWSDVSLCAMADYPQNSAYYSLTSVMVVEGFCFLPRGNWSAQWNHGFIPYVAEVLTDPEGLSGLTPVEGAYELENNKMYQLTIASEKLEASLPESVLKRHEPSGRYLAAEASLAYARDNTYGWLEVIHEYEVYHAIEEYRFEGHSAPLHIEHPGVNNMTVELDGQCDIPISFTVTAQ